MHSFLLYCKRVPASALSVFRLLQLPGQIWHIHLLYAYEGFHTDVSLNLSALQWHPQNHALTGTLLSGIPPAVSVRWSAQLLLLRQIQSVRQALLK